MKKLKEFFSKSSKLTVKLHHNTSSTSTITTNILAFQPAQQETYVLKNDSDSCQMVGTYGLSPWDLFNPFKQNSNLVWLIMYQQGLIKDVTAEIIHPTLGNFVITVNNPMIGIPYAILYNNAVSVAIPMAGCRFNLDENQSYGWSSDKGLNISIARNQDSDYKEFVLTVFL